MFVFLGGHKKETFADIVIYTYYNIINNNFFINYYCWIFPVTTYLIFIYNFNCLFKHNFENISNK